MEFRDFYLITDCYYCGMRNIYSQNEYFCHNAECRGAIEKFDMDDGRHFEEHYLTSADAQSRHEAFERGHKVSISRQRQ